MNPVRLIVDATNANRVYYTMGNTLAFATINLATFQAVSPMGVIGTSPGGPGSFEFTELIVDPAGGFLLTTEGGIWRYTGTAWQSKNSGLQISLVNSVAHTLLTDSLMYAGTRFTGLLRYDDNDNVADWTGLDNSPNTVGRVLADHMNSDWVYWVSLNGIHNATGFQLRYSANRGASSQPIPYVVPGSTYSGSLGLSGGDIMRPVRPTEPSPSPPAAAPDPQTPFTGAQTRYYFPPLEMDPNFNRLLLATNALWQIVSLRTDPAATQLGDTEGGVVTWQYWNDVDDDMTIDPGEVSTFSSHYTFFTTQGTVPATTIRYERHPTATGGAWVPAFSFFSFMGNYINPWYNTTGNADELRSIAGGALAAFTDATGSPQRVWIATADLIQNATSGGDVDPTPGNPAGVPNTPAPPPVPPPDLGRTPIRWVDIAVSGSNSTDIGVAYIVAANFRGPHSSPYGTAVLQSQVYMTTDGGSTWMSIGDDLPDVPARAIAVEPRGPGWQDDVLYVGTDGGHLNGQYASLFKGTYNAALNKWVWTPMNPTSPSGTRLPLVPITDLQINQQFSTLLVATYGRGIWGLYVNVNHPPEIKAPNSVTISEDTQLIFQAGTATEISVTDKDAGLGNLRFTLQVQHGTLQLAGTTGLTLISGGNGTSSMTYQGPLSAINAALGNFTYKPNANYYGFDTLTITVSDLKNSGVQPPAVPPDYATLGWTTTETVQIRITPVNQTSMDPLINDAPILTVPATTQTLDMHQVLVFTSANNNAISVSDVDASIHPMTLTLSLPNAGHGTLTLGSTAGLLSVTGNGTHNITATGPLAAINNALSGLRYTPAVNFSGNTTLTVTVNDNGHIGAGGPQSDTETVNITVNSSNNDAPFLSVPGPQDLLVNTFLHLTGLQIQSEPDAGTGAPWNGDHPVRFTVSVSHGRLRLLNPGSLYLVVGPNDGTASRLTFEGPVSAVNTALAAGLRYTPNTGFVGTDTLVFTVNDLGATGPGNPRSDSDIVLLRVLNANQPPVNTVPGPQTTPEDTVHVFSVANGNAISIADPDAGTNPVQVTLSVTNGTLTLATVSGLTFSAGDGTDDATMTFTGTITAINAALNGLQFRPATNYSGPATLTITTNDLGNSGFGGALTDSDTVTITVTAVNDAPVVAFVNAHFTPVNTTLTFSSLNGNALSASDVDAGSGTISFTLSVTNGTLTLTTPGPLSVSGNGTSSISGSGTLADLNTALANGLVFTPATNFVGIATLTFTVNDEGNTGSGGPKQDRKTVKIAVGTPPNQPPVNAVPPPLQTTNEDEPLYFGSSFGNAITFDTPAALDHPLEVQLSVSQGRLFLGRTTGIRFVSGANGSNNFTIHGTVFNVQEALENLVYIPNLNYVGMDSLVMTAKFWGETVGDSTTIPISIVPANDPPRVSMPGLQTVSAGGTLVFSTANGNALSATDLDAVGGLVQFTLQVSAGTLILLNTSGLNTISGNGTSLITGTATLLALNTALGNGLQFNAPNANTVVTLTFTVNDQGNTGVGGAQLHSARTLIRVGAATADANQGPNIVIQGGVNKTVLEDRPFNFSSSSGHAITINDPDAGSNIVEVQLSVSSGNLVLPTIAGLEFVAGANGDSNMTVRGSLGAINAALSGMTYRPPVDFTGSATLQIQVNDLGNVGSGAPQTANATINLNVQAVNDAPLVYVPRGQSTAANTPLTLGGANAITLFDPDLSLTSTVQFAVSVDFGTLTFLSPGSLTLTGNGVSNVVTGIGTYQDLVNALNAGLRFDPPSGFVGSATLQFMLDDLGASGAGGPQASTGFATIGVNVTPTPVSLLIRSPSELLINEDTNLVFSHGNNNRISISDPDSDASASASDVVQVQLTVTTGTLTLPSTTDLTFVAGANGTSSMTFRGTISAINTAMDGLLYTPPANFHGVAILTITTNDLGHTGGGAPSNPLTDTDTVTIKVRPVNDAPVAVVPGTQTIVTGAGLVFSSANGNAFDFTDIELTSASTVEVTLSVNQGMLHLPDTNGLLFVAGENNTSSFTVRGSLGLIKSRLDGLIYKPPAGSSGTATLTVTINDLGQTGIGGPLSDTKNVTINFQAANQPPTVSVPASQPIPIFRNQTHTFPGTISVSDPNGNVLVEVTLSATSGRINLPSMAGLTLVSGSNNSPSLTFQGPVNTVNARLNGMQFIPATDFDGIVVLTVTVNDLGNTGVGGPMARTNSVLINVQPVNSEPTGFLSQVVFNLVEDDPTTHPITIQYLTPGGGIFEHGQNLDLTMTSTHPSLFNIFHFQATGFPVLNLTGGSGVYPTAEIMEIRVAPNKHGTSVATVTIKDNGGTANGGDDTLTLTFTVHVSPVNDAPVLTSGTYDLYTIPEDPPTNTGVSVQAFVASLGGSYTDADDFADVNNPTYTDPRGIAIINYGTTNGTWQYSLNGGSTWANFPTLSSGEALVLAANATTRVRFVPNANFNGTATFTFRAWDQSNGAGNGSVVTIGGTGGTTPYSANTAIGRVIITEVNDTPVGTASPTSINIDEDAPTQTITISGITPGGGNDELTQNLTLQVTSSNTGLTGTPTITPTSITGGMGVYPTSATVQFTPQPNQFGSATLTITITDNGTTNGVSDPKTLTIEITVTVNPVNDDPVLVINAGLTLNEGAIGTINNSLLAATDVDNSPNQIIFTITTPPAHGQVERFNGSAWVPATSFTQADLNAGNVRYVHDGSETTSDQFTFALSDSSGGSGGSHTFAITITPVNDPPTVDLNGGGSGNGFNNTVTYPAPGGPTNKISLAPAPATIDDPDSANLVQLVITLTNPFAGDVLEVDETAGGTVSGISKSVAGNTITLSGTKAIADYIAVLQTLKYHNTNPFPNLTPRVVTVQAKDDAGAAGNIANVTINIAGGTPPVVDLNNTISGVQLTQTNTLPTPRLITTGTVVNIGNANWSVSDTDSPVLSFAQVVLPSRPDGNANEELIVNVGGTGLSATYNPATGVLQISGPGSVSDFQTVLQSLQYINRAVVPDPTSRTIQVFVNDGYNNSALATITVQVSGPAQAPQLDLDTGQPGTGYSASFATPGPGSVFIANNANATVTDGDSQGLMSIVAVLQGPLPDGSDEYLSADTSGTPLTASYNPATQTLTIQGPGSLSDFQTVLRKLRYHNNKTFPNLAQRQILITAFDGYNNSNTATALVNFLGGLPPQVDLNGSGSGINFSADAQTPGPFNGANAIAVAGSTGPTAATINDPDSPKLVWVRAVLTARPDGDTNERLTVNVGATGLTATYTAATGELLITASLPQHLSLFEQVLRTLKYENDLQFPTGGSRTIQVTAFDGYNVSAVAPATVTFRGPAPPLVDLNGPGGGVNAGTNFTTTLLAGTSQVVIADSDLVIQDSDSTHMVSATIQVVSPSFGETEGLDVTYNLTGTGISKSYIAATRTLTLTGLAPKSRYEAVLKTLIYVNPTPFPNATPRQIEVRVNDGYSTSVASLAYVNIGGTTPPVVDLNGPASSVNYATPAWQTPGPVPGIYIVDPSSAFIQDTDSPNLNYMDVVFVNRPDGANENLQLDANGTAGTSLQVVSLPNGIRIQGIGGAPQPVSEFETVLRRLQYTNSLVWPNPTPRTITISVNDGYSTVTAQSTVSFLGAAAPSVDLNGQDQGGTGFAAIFNPVTRQVSIVDTSPGTNGLVIQDSDSTHLARAVITLTNAIDPGERVDVDMNLSGTGITKSYSNGVLTLEGVAPVGVYENVLRHLVYINPRHFPAPTTRTITVRVHDGYSFSAAATATVSMPGVNLAPEVDLNGGSSGINHSVQFPTSGNSVLIAPSGIVRDDDSVLINRIEIRITNALDGAHESFTYNTAGTNINATLLNGRLVLSGADTPDNYQQVLRTVRYVNNAPLPNPEPRVITVFAHDGYNNSATATTTVSFPPVRSQPHPSGQVLYIVGTNGNDIIQIKPGANTNQFRVNVNGQDRGTFNMTQYRRVFVFGLAGHDRIEVDRTLNVRSLLSGGAGNDVLLGGAGPDILLGGPGNDQLIGRDGRDLLIGGAGTDALYGHEVLTQNRIGSDEDILIGDSTVYDADLMALAQILDRWAGTGTYQQRITALLNGNGVPQLNTSKIVFDNAVDELFGGWDNDWFFRLNNQDNLRDRVATERIN
ncbi:MAG: cadherin-like domain-containing protein [Gemmatales bacterium]|nr:cadherin-like domain-containing protein [Gemmatales bacterium]